MSALAAKLSVDMATVSKWPSVFSLHIEIRRSFKLPVSPMSPEHTHTYSVSLPKEGCVCLTLSCRKHQRTNTACALCSAALTETEIYLYSFICFATNRNILLKFITVLNCCRSLFNRVIQQLMKNVNMKCTIWIYSINLISTFNFLYFV